MRKRLTKMLITFALALTFLLGSSGFALAAETETYIHTESMEIRIEGKTGLRTIASIDKKYYEQFIENGKKVTYGTVAVPASALEADGRELVIGGSYKLNGKSYSALTIPAEKNWKTTEDKLYFTGVLTGISGSGFNTRYAVRAYITVDEKTTYGNVLAQSSYVTAQKMLQSQETTSEDRAWLAKNILDACDDAKKVTQQTLTITAEQVKNGTYELGATSKVRNYKNIMIDSSVQDAEIILDNLRVRNLEVSAEANCTITADNTSFDTISKKLAGARGESGNVVLNLGTGSSVAKLSAASNLTVNGALKVAEVTVDTPVTNFVINVPAEELNVSKQTGGSNIIVNSNIENATLNGTDSTISGTGKLDKVQDNGNNHVDIEIGEDLSANEIISVEVRGMNRMVVTLAKDTEKVLTGDDMTIHCHGGKDMTILKVETTNRKVYTVTTSVFAKDDTYTFSIEIDGKIIQKEFSYKVDCPTVSNATVLRSEETRAEFDLFDVDDGGYVYVYIPGHTQTGRNETELPSVETVKKGYKEAISVGFNKVLLRGLDAGISYPLYYVLEAYDGRTSDVFGPLTINGTVEEEPNISPVYEIVSVSEKPRNTITIRLNQAPEETLTLDNFSFICPTGSEITTDKATLKISEDRLVYTIVIPDNYYHKDNQYVAKITFSDGTVAKKRFEVKYNPPVTTLHKVERIAEDKVRYTFTSDKEGVFYFGTYNFNGEYGSENNTPTAEQILNGEVISIKKQMYSGSNSVEIPYNGKDKDWFAIHVDAYGNYANYTEHDKIPAYVPPKPEESELAIESVVYNKDYSGSMSTCLDITFTTSIDELPMQELISFEVISGSSVGKLLLERSFLDSEQKVLRIRSLNMAFKPGTYKISMYVYKDGIPKKVAKEFVID